jgi:hypothetical protein
VTVTCHDALARIAVRDLDGWAGLPACTLADVEAVWRPSEAAARPVVLGRETAEAQHVDTGDGWVRVWSRDGAVVLIDIDGPLEVDVAALGEPDARLTAHAGFASYPDGELVFAARGLAVGVAPESGVVLYAAVFAPCSVEDYTARLQIDRKQRPIPMGDTHGL